MDLVIFLYRLMILIWVLLLKLNIQKMMNLKTECKKALQQISQKNYTEGLYQNGIHHILKYGIVCQRKRCCVLLEKE